MLYSPKVERKLAAIMFTDIVGYTKIIGDSESKGLNILKKQESLISPLVDEYNGKIINTTGDGYLIEFSSSVESVECAIKMQEMIKKYNSVENNLEFHIRIGIHLGDIAVVGDNILGEGVNIASRIEPMASPDGICMTEAVYQSIKSKLKISPKRISDVDLKHIDEKHTIYKLNDEETEKSESNVLYQDSNDYNINMKNIIRESIDIPKFISIFFSLLLFVIIFGFTVGMIISFLITLIPFLSSVYIYFDGDPSKLFDFNSLLNPKGSNGLMMIFIIICTFITTKKSIYRRFIVTFEDIRDVNKISGITIKQMGYKLLSNNKQTFKYYYPIESKGFLIRLFTLSFIPFMHKQITKLILSFDGNTITIQCRNQMFTKFLKSLENLSN